jgi:hypothetical protein
MFESLFLIIKKYLRNIPKFYIKALACILLVLFILILNDIKYQNNYSYLQDKLKILGLFELGKNEPKSPTIFCLVLTKKSDLNTEAKLMYETWVKRCDKYKYLTLIPDELLANNTNYNITHGIDIRTKDDLELLQPPSYTKESYSVLTHKVFRSFVYVYQHYEPYDWYFKA